MLLKMLCIPNAPKDAPSPNTNAPPDAFPPYLPRPNDPLPRPNDPLLLTLQSTRNSATVTALLLVLSIALKAVLQTQHCL